MGWFGFRHDLDGWLTDLLSGRILTRFSKDQDVVDKEIAIISLQVRRVAHLPLVVAQSTIPGTVYVLFRVGNGVSSILDLSFAGDHIRSYDRAVLQLLLVLSTLIRGNKAAGLSG